ncbi:MAG: ATP-binding cassette domain-containing protein [Planctomycetota bacterium]|nr:ATP-binding cassette domain-containing protein [Planctomycetota bacterium]
MKMNYCVSRKFCNEVKTTDKVLSVMRMFGLTKDKMRQKNVAHNCQVEINDGDIVYITGPSGAGKSVLLKELAGAIEPEQKVDIDDINLSAPKGQAPGGQAERAVVDCIEGDYIGALRILSYAGLNDCLCVLNSPSCLSEGQKYRFRLAIALGAKKKFIIADEFCSNLDRITASTISYTIHKFAKRYKVTFLLASSHEDMLADLQPDVIIRKELSGPTKVVYKNSG